MSIGGMKSISFEMVGQLHLADHHLIVEWTGTRTTEKFGFSGIGTDKDQLPLEELEIPLDYIVSARLVRAWWLPRLELRSYTLDLFDDIPGSKPGVVTLKIKRRDRAQALEFILALEAAQDTYALDTGGEYDAVTDGAVNRLGEGSTSEF